MVFISVEADPTGWVLAEPSDASLISRPGDTVSIPVAAPLAGTLLISRKSAASVAVFTLGESGDVIPSAVKFATPVLYLPSPNGYTLSATGPAGGSLVYQLPAGSDLTALGSEIAAAMSAGSSLSIKYGNPVSNGTLWLNGAAVPFVVLCPVTPTAALPAA
jgi:hypothetical protein